ncbi:MAG: cell division protein ZapB [Pseudomonadota bacterium]
MNADGFEHLEEKINKLLSSYDEIKRERSELKSTLEKKDEELKAVRGELERIETERTEMRTRIGSLLAKLEGIDLSL